MAKILDSEKLLGVSEKIAQAVLKANDIESDLQKRIGDSILRHGAAMLARYEPGYESDFSFSGDPTIFSYTHPENREVTTFHADFQAFKEEADQTKRLKLLDGIISNALTGVSDTKYPRGATYAAANISKDSGKTYTTFRITGEAEGRVAISHSIPKGFCKLLTTISGNLKFIVE